jgi:pantoate--beta-alanine ligase
MKIVKSIPEMNDLASVLRKGGATIGFVPTMGALHEGHMSLVTESRKRTDMTVMSIFVNPAQFGPQEDYGKYPRMFPADCAKAEAAGCDIVFAPEAPAMYPDHYHTYVTVEGLGGKLCGVSRPTHFRGVATVVLKFFNIVNPHIAFFGSKDAQQVIVLKRMIEDLHLAITLEACPTIRESDGLAMSSRNVYLTPAERTAAPVIRKGLLAASALFESGERSVEKLKRVIAVFYQNEPIIRKEFIDIVDTIDLNPLITITSAALIAIACRTAESGTRLIDNIVVGGSL